MESITSGDHRISVLSNDALRERCLKVGGTPTVPRRLMHLDLMEWDSSGGSNVGNAVLHRAVHLTDEQILRLVPRLGDAVASVVGADDLVSNRQGTVEFDGPELDDDATPTDQPANSEALSRLMPLLRRCSPAYHEGLAYKLQRRVDDGGVGMDNSTAHNDPLPGEAPAPPCLLDNEEGESAERRAANDKAKADAIERMETLIKPWPPEFVTQFVGLAETLTEAVA